MTIKRFLIVLAAVFLVVGAYFAIFDYLKSAGVKILVDKSSHVVKGDDTYLHYKIYNDKLLKNYGVDFRLIVAQKKIKPPKDLRKGAKSYVVVLLDDKGNLKSIKISQNLKSVFDEDFIDKIKQKKYKDIKQAVIKTTESFLDREIELKK
jgi:hypothetical protein